MEATLRLVAVAAIVGLIVPALGAGTAPTPPLEAPLAGLAGADPVRAALALAAGAARATGALPPIPVDPSPRGLYDVVLDLCRQAGFQPDAPLAASVSVNLSLVPPDWQGGLALVGDAVLAAAGAASQADAVAAAQRVSDAVVALAAGVEAPRAGASTFTFRDPCGVMLATNAAEDDVHAHAYALLVDGAGNDRYVGPHAGATLRRPVSVVVDLDGNDRFESRGASSAQGGSALGVLGFLYDAAGNDSYVADRGSVDPAAFQGGCWGAGVGLLVDAAGSDSYTARFADQGGAQGAGYTCAGILVDLAGSDSYVAGEGRARAVQGAGFLGGAGVLVDRQGSDRYQASALVSQGHSAAGLGVLLDGHGDDLYNGDASPNNKIDTGPSLPLHVGPDSPAEASVRADLVGLPASSGPVVYDAEISDADGDGTPAVRLKTRDVVVSASGDVEFANEGYVEAGRRETLGDPDDEEGLERVALAGGARCVLAVVDTGINPYHRAFRAALPPPATWIPGYPADATPLALALDAPTYAEAVARDNATWQALERERLYAVPGTRIVGAVSFGAVNSSLVGERRVLDDDGHGTAVTGAAVALAPQCGIVAVEAGDLPRALRWIAKQSWIDAASVSLGTLGGLYLPSEVANATRMVARSGKPVLVAGGNGLTRLDVPDPTPSPMSPYSGAPWVVSVGAVSPWNEQSTWWGAYPVDVASLGVNVPAPSHEALEDTISFSGSSAAAPRVAGAAVAALSAARAAVAAGSVPTGPLADGVLTRGEWERVVLATARTVSVDDSLLACTAREVQHCLLDERWYLYLLPAVPTVEYLTMGYGIVDAATRDAAVRVLRGEAPMPERPNADRLWRAAHAVREQFWATHDDFGLLLTE